MAGYDARFLDGRQHSCEPQACTDSSLGSSVVSDGHGTLYSYTGIVCGPLGYVASDMDDTVFKCLVPPCISDGTLLRCGLLVATGQEFDGLEDLARTRDGVCPGDHCGAEGAHGVAGTYPGVWDDRTSHKVDNHPLMCLSEGGFGSVPEARATHDGHSLALQGQCLSWAQRATRPS